MTALTVDVVERRDRAMNTSVHVVAVGASPELIDRSVARLHELEQRWSRFVPSSEVSAMNRAPERFHVVSADTALLVERSVQAWQLTDGAFDPSVLEAVIALGYDRSFEKLTGDSHAIVAAAAAPGCGQIEISLFPNGGGLVMLGPGVGFDPGGIGKGLAADLVVAELLAGGAAGALVNIGGDLVCRGAAPTADGWIVEVREPSVADEPVALLALDSGAVATSTTKKRSWLIDGKCRHHVVDPAQGDCTSGLILATVIADEGWRAEALATQLLVSGDHRCINPTEAAAVVVDRTGRRTSLGILSEFAR